MNNDQDNQDNQDNQDDNINHKLTWVNTGDDKIVSYQSFLSELFPSKYQSEKAYQERLSLKRKRDAFNKLQTNKRVKNKQDKQDKEDKQDKQDKEKEYYSEQESQEESQAESQEEYNEEYNEEYDEEYDEEHSENENNSKYNIKLNIESDLYNKAIILHQFREAINKYNNEINSESEYNSESEDDKIDIEVEDLESETITKKKNLVSVSKSKNREIRSTLRQFRELLKTKNVFDDFNYFKNKLSLTQQKNILNELKLINNHTEIVKPYRLKLIESRLPVKYKSIALRKLNALNQLEPGSGEYHKLKTWLDKFMRIPFGEYNNIPVSFQDNTREECCEYMNNAKKTLDKAVYGMDNVKIQFLQLLGQWITNKDAVGTAIAVKGPMGTGKTTIIKDGISKILGRDFIFIALGGATDSSFLEGHSYTYEGSCCGKIIESLVQCKSMNPIIFFDELDKVSKTTKGDEINGILTHLTDTSQNTMFHDKYFSEVEFDLSKALFVFSYNDESKINPILLDRMYKVETNGYLTKEKTTIATKYLLPNIYSQLKFTDTDIIFNNDIISHIINNYTEQEKGVRNLKRCLEIIMTKLNIYRLMDSKANNIYNDTLNIKFPINISINLIDKFLKKTEKNAIWKNLYI